MNKIRWTFRVSTYCIPRLLAILNREVYVAMGNIVDSAAYFRGAVSPDLICPEVKLLKRPTLGNVSLDSTNSFVPPFNL
jgi:hypothetical protein